MSFAVAGNAYDALVGRWSRPLAPLFADFAGVGAAPGPAGAAAGGRGPALDVGCGPGALTSLLAARLGPAAVAAVDPSPPFAAACRERVPGADVREAPAERLPFGDGAFGAALSQLVLSFVGDPAAAAAEMRRVVRTGGVVAACTWAWDGFDMARVFWDAALAVDPAAPDDAGLPFRREGELEALLRGAGLRGVEAAEIPIEVTYSGFDDYWGPFAGGVGPPGGWLVRQPPDRQEAVRRACVERLGRPAGAFTLRARALAVRGRA